MWKQLILILMTFLAFSGVAMGDITSHPNWANINAYSASFVSTIKTYQDQFFIVNGKYFQGLALLGPDVKPDGTTDIQTINTAAPVDQLTSWKDFAPAVFKVTLKIPIQITLNVYHSPDGWGWVLRAECWYAGLDPDQYGTYGNHWVYMHNEGPEEMNQIQDQWYIEVEGP